MSNQFETPVLFLIFNRPDTTRQVFNQIKQVRPKYLYISADGPRLNKEGEFEKCLETRTIASQIDWNCELKTLFREENLGCGVAVSSAITWFFDQVESGIILEDDCLPDLSFFLFCEDLLNRFKDDEQIMLIGGNNFQNGIQRGTGSYYYSNYPHIWGWASWRRAWKHYKYDIGDDELNFMSKSPTIHFNRTQTKYLKKNILKVLNGEINTWDVQWVYSIWKNNGYSITPNCNLVINTGFRNASTSTFLRDSFKEIKHFKTIDFPLIHPLKEIDLSADRQTYKNVYGHSPKRLVRLFAENNIMILINYVVNKIITKMIRLYAKNGSSF